MKKTYQEWKMSQIALANQRLAHYFELVQSLEAQGKPPSDPIFDYLANLGWLETFRIEIMSYHDHKYYHSSDGDLIYS